jgi:hypothetical protein
MPLKRLLSYRRLTLVAITGGVWVVYSLAKVRVLPSPQPT